MKKLNSYWTFINVFHCLIIVLSDVGWNLWEYDESKHMKQENGMDTFGKEKMEQKCLLMMNNNIFASFMNIMVNSELAQNIGNKSLLSGYHFSWKGSINNITLFVVYDIIFTAQLFPDVLEY